MPIKRSYRLGSEFPFEGFVQDAIERHFRSRGFIIDTASRVDLLCSHPLTGEQWHIEAKGETSQSGLDFRTCLGQLVQHVRAGETRYGIALPDVPRYRHQIAAVSSFVIDRLGLHWLMVSADGSVEVVAPRS